MQRVQNRDQAFFYDFGLANLIELLTGLSFKKWTPFFWKFFSQKIIKKLIKYGIQNRTFILFKKLSQNQK